MKQPTILFEDKDILVCFKPAGMPVQTKSLGSMDLEHFLKNHLLRQMHKEGIPPKQQPYLAVIHRLDQPVSGILVFAKTPNAAKKLNHQMQNDGFTKEYEAIACGLFSEDSGTLVDYLVKDGRTNTSRICPKDTPDAKRAELSYVVRNRFPKKGLTQVRIRLKTGRHHQIRVQMAGNQTPLWGDNKYNPAFADKKGYVPIALCARHLEFTHPATGEKLSYEITCEWPQI
ncbi:MAG: RNA pseudouridine synthase [Lachnospiraceae bacterium]|nr:RNA pseudouridine synthase [Lachnospiraceae bacterium]